MRTVVKLSIIIFFLLNTTISHASPQSVTWYDKTGDQVSLNVDLFITTTCPHCQKADAFFSELEKNEPWLVIHRHVINQDKSALKLFFERLQQQTQLNFSVPAIFFCDSHWTGFSDAKTTGAVLLRALSYCQQQITKQGELSQITIDVLRQQGKASQVHITEDIAKSTTRFILFSALSDASRACSLFILMALLAFLSLNRGLKRWHAGVAFIVALGVIHYIEQTNTALFYNAINWFRIPAALVGVMLLFFIRSHSQKRASRSSVLYLGITSLIIMSTSVMVYVYQQTCGVNIGLVFERWLLEHSITGIRRLAYNLAYQAVYLSPLILLSIIYVAVCQHRRILPYQCRLTIAAYMPGCDRRFANCLATGIDKLPDVVRCLCSCIVMHLAVHQRSP